MAIPGTRRIDRNATTADVSLSDEDLGSLDRSPPPSVWAGDRSGFAVSATARRACYGQPTADIQ